MSNMLTSLHSQNVRHATISWCYFHSDYYVGSYDLSELVM